MVVMNDRLLIIYQHDPNIVTRLIAGEMILVPIRKNMGDLENIYTLNETAARSWELLDGEHTLGEIRDRLVAEYEVTAEQAWDDLLELLESLQSVGAIQAV